MTKMLKVRVAPCVWQRSWLVLILTLPSGLLAASTPLDNAWDILKDGTSASSIEKRSDATQALGLLIRNDRARLMAEKALADNVPEVRAAAATALGEMRATASIPKLHEA